MTKLIWISVMLLSAIATPPVQAADKSGSMRHFLEFCNQFVITDPGPGIGFDYYHDCYLNDWDAPRRWYDDTNVSIPTASLRG
jgi:hypothetical protein